MLTRKSLIAKGSGNIRVTGLPVAALAPGESATVENSATSGVAMRVNCIAIGRWK